MPSQPDSTASSAKHGTSINNTPRKAMNTCLLIRYSIFCHLPPPGKKRAPDQAAAPQTPAKGHRRTANLADAPFGARLKSLLLLSRALRLRLAVSLRSSYLRSRAIQIVTTLFVIVSFSRRRRPPPSTLKIVRSHGLKSINYWSNLWSGEALAFPGTKNLKTGRISNVGIGN